MTLGEFIVGCLVVWLGYELACLIIRACRWVYAWRQSRKATGRIAAWERSQARRTPRSRDRSGMIPCLALFVLVRLLSGCASTPPRIVDLPPVCPALPDRPAQADTVFPEFLPLLSTPLADADAAGEVLRVRVDSAALYQACRVNNAALADWSIRHSR